MDDLQQLLNDLHSLPPDEPNEEWDLSPRIWLVLTIGELLRESSQM